MTEERWETRRTMYKYHLMGMDMPSVIREFSVVDGAFSEREYKRLHMDWGRKDGPRGWVQKLVREGEIEDTSNRHIYGLRLIQANSLKVAFDPEANQFARIGAQNSYLNAVEMERKIMGIRPPVLPEVLTADEVMGVQERGNATWAFNLVRQMLGIEAAVDIADKLNRQSLELDSQKEKMPRVGESL